MWSASGSQICRQKLPLGLPLISIAKNNQISTYSIPTQVDKRFFVITPYIPNEKGELRAILPDRCPRNQQHGTVCRLSLNHYRERATGPCFSVAVIRCRSHSIYFTLYPHGYIPYGRQRLVANISEWGSPVIDDLTDEPSETDDLADDQNEDRKLSPFRESFFAAALSAGKGEKWLADSVQGSMKPRFSTQRRHLDRIFRILGIHSFLNFRQRELISELLQIPGQIIHDSVSALNARTTIEQRGQIILHLLTFLIAIPFPYNRLTEAGSVVNLWPNPCFWDVEEKAFSTFQPPGIRGSP